MRIEETLFDHPVQKRRGAGPVRADSLRQKELAVGCGDDRGADRDQGREGRRKIAASRNHHPLALAVNRVIPSESTGILGKTNRGLPYEKLALPP